MTAVSEPSLLLRSLNIGLVALYAILLAYAVRDYATDGTSVKALLLPIGGVSLAVAMLIGHRRPRLSWMLLATSLVANAAWFLRYHMAGT